MILNYLFLGLNVVTAQLNLNTSSTELGLTWKWVCTPPTHPTTPPTQTQLPSQKASDCWAIICVFWHCNNCPRGNCPRRQLSKWLLSKGQLSKETFVQERLLSKWQFFKETIVQGRLLSKKSNTYIIFVQGTFVTEMKKKIWKLLGTKK